MDMLELIRTMFEIKSFLDELNSILDTANEVIRDCEDRSFEITQGEGQK